MGGGSGGGTRETSTPEIKLRHDFMGGDGGRGIRESITLEIELRCSILWVVGVVATKGSPPPRHSK